MARLTSQGAHIVLKCTGDDCGMRYPSPADHHRRDACPLCAAPTTVEGAYPNAIEVTDRPPREDARLEGVLDNIRSALNVGTMFRSADGTALDHLYLTGLTAGVENPKVAKTALGAIHTVPSTSLLDGVARIAALRDEGYEVWAIDRTSSSVPLTEVKARPTRLAFVVGNELAGVDPAVLNLADRHVHLEMHGSKTTLNVGVAFGVVAFWLRSLPVAAGPPGQASG